MLQNYKINLQVLGLSCINNVHIVLMQTYSISRQNNFYNNVAY